MIKIGLDPFHFLYLMPWSYSVMLSESAVIRFSITLLQDRRTKSKVISKPSRPELTTFVRSKLGSNTIAGAVCYFALHYCMYVCMYVYMYVFLSY